MITEKLKAMIELSDEEWAEILNQQNISISMFAAFLAGMECGLVVNAKDPGPEESELDKLNLPPDKLKELWKEIGLPRVQEMLKRVAELEREKMS